MHGVGIGKYWEERDTTSDKSGKRLKWRCKDGVERNTGYTDGKWRRFTAGLGDIGDIDLGDFGDFGQGILREIVKGREWRSRGCQRQLPVP